MKNKIFYLSICLSFAFISACSEDQNLFDPEDGLINSDYPSETSTLIFTSKLSLHETIHFLKENPFRSNSGNLLLPNGLSFFERKDYESFYNDYVPDTEFAQLLNHKGEIIVADTLYRVTTNGTYYCHIDKKDVLDKIIEADSLNEGFLLDDKLYQVAEGVYRYDSFHYMRENQDFYFYDEDGYNYCDDGYTYDDNTAETEENQNSIFRSSGIPQPNMDGFPIFSSTQETVLKWLARNILRVDKVAPTVNHPCGKRRVKGEFGTVNLVVYNSVHVKAWTDKKNTIGWSKTEADELRIGWRNVFIAVPIHTTPATSIPSGIVHNPQSIRVPGSMYTHATRAFTIPDAQLSAFQNAAAKGAGAVFNFIKTTYTSMNQSDWDKINAALIYSRTHLFIYIKNEDIVRTNIKEFSYTFAESAQFVVTLNPNSFNLSGNTTLQTIQQLIGLISETTKIAAPTLHTGEAYIASRFGSSGDCWRGMKIVKN
jgi:hypothetical protein